MAVAILERFKQESMYGLSTGTKNSGHCKEVAVSGDSAVYNFNHYSAKYQSPGKLNRSYDTIIFDICHIENNNGVN